MSKFRDLIIDVQEDIEQGILSFSQICMKYGLAYSEIDMIAKEMLDTADFDAEYSKSQEAYSLDEYDFG